MKTFSPLSWKDGWSVLNGKTLGFKKMAANQLNVRWNHCSLTYSNNQVYFLFQSDGVQQTTYLARRYCEEAIRQISRLRPSPERDALIRLTEIVLSRDKWRSRGASISLFRQLNVEQTCPAAMWDKDIEGGWIGAICWLATCKKYTKSRFICGGGGKLRFVEVISEENCTSDLNLHLVL